MRELTGAQKFPPPVEQVPASPFAKSHFSDPSAVFVPLARFATTQYLLALARPRPAVRGGAHRFKGGADATFTVSLKGPRGRWSVAASKQVAPQKVSHGGKGG